MSTEKQAGIYLRISDDKTNEGRGVARQEQDCRKVAKSLDAKIVDTFSDNDTSAYSGVTRPGYKRLLDAISTGRINVVIAWHNDRLHRSPKELEYFIDLIEETGAEVHFATSGQFDLSTPTGRMIARQVGVLARYESEHRAERITRAHRQGAEQGRYRGGSSRVFGYQADAYTLNVEEAAALRTAYRSVLAGESLGSILRAWDEAGIRTTNDNKFAHITLRTLLLRPRNYGASVYKGEVVGTGQWVPIVDEATFRQVEAILKDPGRIKNKTNKAKYLMSGVMACGKCEANSEHGVMGSFIASQDGRKVHYYRCRNCHSNYIKIGETDDFISQLVIARITRPDSEIPARLVEEEPSPDLEQEARGLRARLTELVDMFASGEVTRAQHARASESIKARLSKIEAELASVPGRSLMAGLMNAENITDAWEHLTIAQRKEIVNALMTVTLQPVGKGYVRRYQPERLGVDWK